jgi:ribonuclease P protein component
LRLETLKRRGEYDRVRHGRKWVAASFILQSAIRGDGHDSDPARFGFVVGSKALKGHQPGEAGKRPGAVIRNRARRRLKEAVRHVAGTHARPGYDYVIIGRRESLHQSFADLLEELQLAFGKVNRPPGANDGKPRPAKQRKASAKDNQGHLGTIAGDVLPQISAKEKQAGQPVVESDHE